jgi:hypothetical protein
MRPNRSVEQGSLTFSGWAYHFSRRPVSSVIPNREHEQEKE